jgi:solute carrier family 27 fatty acid transporter 1/4
MKNDNDGCINDFFPSLFSKINDLKNRIANVFLQHGFKHGDKVGLLMENRPEFVAIWLGLSKIGIIIPLINHNLKKQSLLHSITIAECKAFIFGESLTECKCAQFFSTRRP